MAALMVFIVFLIAIAVSVPIGVAMCLGTLFPQYFMNAGAPVDQLINFTLSGADSTPILAVPLFILGGVIMAEGGISRRLFNFFSYFVGNIPGGVPCAAILTCLFYGAISGSGPATTAAVEHVYHDVLRLADAVDAIRACSPGPLSSSCSVRPLKSCSSGRWML